LTEVHGVICAIGLLFHSKSQDGATIPGQLAVVAISV